MSATDEDKPNVIKSALSRRKVLLAGTSLAVTSTFGSARAQAPAAPPAAASSPPAPPAPRGTAIGSPAGTRTIPGDVLPPHDLPWGGTANLNAPQSTAWWQPRIVPPAGAPNVLLIITDDVGFGAPSTFGGVIPTPALDRIAANGLRYTNFNTTALCSPTRSALITGKNHHSNGFGVISEFATGFPGYNSVIPRDTTTIGRILREHGYRTSWFGKNHNTPSYETTQAGPFNQWPVGMGFEYFYGFMGGETDQWAPNLFRNTTSIYPYMNQPGWNLITAMADEAVGWLDQLNALDPSLPFFLYYAPGGAHAPHQPTPEWDKKISDMHLFDKGWNALRDQIFANQKKLGVIPQDAKLTPWPDDLLKTWDKLTAEEQKLFIRQANVWAAYLAYTDHEIGRVIQAVEDAGKLDNTLIIFISGDNGCSAEGSMTGSPNVNATYNGIDIPVAEQMKFYDAWGSNQTYPHFAVPWAWALDAPFKWMKQIPSFFGGTRNGMAISWPARIKDKGGIREQFHHVVDIVPTLLEATGIRAPVTVDGIDQKPIEGTSMVYTFDKANAGTPSTHRTQYFEMMGVQGLYHDGWMLSAIPKRPPWDVAGAGVEDPATELRFELYDLRKDWTQFTDLAPEQPDKVREMTEMMFGEFAKYNVLPLDGRSMAPRFVAPRPSLTTGRKVFTYTTPITGVADSAAPRLLNTSYTITAEIDVPQGADGSIVSDGGRFGGYGLYLLKGRPVFTWNLFDLKRVKWQGPEALAPGKHTIVYDFKYDGLGFATLAFNNASGLGRSGTGTLIIDGNAVSTQKMEHTVPFGFELDAVFDIGSKTATPIDDQDYAVPFVFTGKIDKVTISVEPPVLTDADRLKLIDAQRAIQDAK